MLIYGIIGNSSWHPVGRMPKPRRWVARLDHLRKVEIWAKRARSKSQVYFVNMTQKDSSGSVLMAFYAMLSSHASRRPEQHGMSIN